MFNEQFVNSVYCENILLIVNYIIMNLVFYDIYENIQNIIDMTIYDDIDIHDDQWFIESIKEEV